MPLHGKIVVIKRSGGDGTEFPLTASCLFGRKPDCDIRIQLPQVSKEHCRIELNENKEVILTNLSSVNPTCVNGEVLQQSERLKHGDIITIIDRSFRFEYPPAPTPKKKKRSSFVGKTETLQVLQDQQVSDTTAEAGRKTSEVTTDSYLKDGANHDNIQRSLEKAIKVETKEDGSLDQSKTSSPFNELYQIIKRTLDMKTPRKSSASLPQTPASRFYAQKPVSVRKVAGEPAIATEVKSTPKKVEAEESSGTITTDGNAEAEESSGTITTDGNAEAEESSGTITTDGNAEAEESSGTITTDGNAEAEESSGTITTDDNAERGRKSGGTPKSAKKQRRSLDHTVSQETGLAPEENQPAEQAVKPATPIQETPKSKRRSSSSRTPTTTEAISTPVSKKSHETTPQRFTVSEVVEQITAEKPKTPTRSRSQEGTPIKATVPEAQQEQTEAQPSTPKPEASPRTSPRTSEKKLKAQDVLRELEAAAAASENQQSAKKRKSGELGVVSKRQTKRKRVSFGGHLSPELFDKRLPPDSPLRKGATPRRSLCVPKPKQSVLRRASVIGLMEKSGLEKPAPASPKRKSPAKTRTPSPAKRSPKAKTPSPKSSSPAKRSPKARTPSPKSSSPAMRSPKARTPSPSKNKSPKTKTKTPSPGKSEVTSSPGRKSLPAAAKTPSPARGRSPSKDEPQTPKAEKSPKPQRKSASPAQPQAVDKKSPTGKRGSSPVASTFTPQENTPTVVAVAPAKTLGSKSQTPTVQGRFSVSRISTPSPISEQDAVAVPEPSVVTPKLPLRRKSMKSTSKWTPKSVMKSVVAVMRRRSGVSRASMKVVNSWADIVKFGQTKSQMVVPAKKPPTKTKAKKTVVPKPKTPARKLEDHVSTGHADSPVTIVVGRAHKQRFLHPTGAAPKLVQNMALLKKNMKMDEDLTGIAEIFSTPVNARQGKSVINVQTATKTPQTALTTSVIEASVMNTPEETGEMVVSPLSVVSTAKHGRYNKEAVNRLLESDQETGFVSEIPVLELPTDESTEQQSPDLETEMSTPKQKPAQLDCLTGVKRLMRTPKQKAEPIEDLRGRLLKTPRQKPEQPECLTGVKRIMKTPRRTAEPVEDLRGKLLKTPRAPKTAEEVDFDGIKELLETPKRSEESVEGFSEVMGTKTPEMKNSPLVRAAGIKRMMKTPKERGAPVEDMVGIQRLKKTPRQKGEPVEENFGIQELMKTPRLRGNTPVQKELMEEPQSGLGAHTDANEGQGETSPGATENVPQEDMTRETGAICEAQPEDGTCTQGEDGPADVLDNVPQEDTAQGAVCEEQQPPADGPSDTTEDVSQEDMVQEPEVVCEQPEETSCAQGEDGSSDTVENIPQEMPAQEPEVVCEEKPEDVSCAQGEDGPSDTMENVQEDETQEVVSEEQPEDIPCAQGEDGPANNVENVSLEDETQEPEVVCEEKPEDVTFAQGEDGPSDTMENVGNEDEAKEPEVVCEEKPEDVTFAQGEDEPSDTMENVVQEDETQEPGVCEEKPEDMPCAEGEVEPSDDSVENAPMEDVVQEPAVVCKEQPEEVPCTQGEDGPSAATEDLPQAAIDQHLPEVEPAVTEGTANSAAEPQKRSARGRKTKTVEPKAVDATEQPEEATVPAPVRGRRGKKTEVAAPPMVRQTARGRAAKANESNYVEVPVEASESVALQEAVTLKPRRGRNAKQASLEQAETVLENTVEATSDQTPPTAVEPEVTESVVPQKAATLKPKRGRNAKQASLERAETVLEKTVEPTSDETPPTAVEPEVTESVVPQKAATLKPKRGRNAKQASLERAETALEKTVEPTSDETPPTAVEPEVTESVVPQKAATLKPKRGRNAKQASLEQAELAQENAEATRDETPPIDHVEPGVSDTVVASQEEATSKPRRGRNAKKASVEQAETMQENTMEAVNDQAPPKDNVEYGVSDTVAPQEEAASKPRRGRKGKQISVEQTPTVQENAEVLNDKPLPTEDGHAQEPIPITMNDEPLPTDDVQAQESIPAVTVENPRRGRKTKQDSVEQSKVVVEDPVRAVETEQAAQVPVRAKRGRKIKQDSEEMAKADIEIPPVESVEIKEPVEKPSRVRKAKQDSVEQAEAVEVPTVETPVTQKMEAPAPISKPRRGRKAKQDSVEPAEEVPVESANVETPAEATEVHEQTAVAPADKPRRGGRKTKQDADSIIPPESTEVQDKPSANPSEKPKRGRKIKQETVDEEVVTISQEPEEKAESKQEVQEDEVADAEPASNSAEEQPEAPTVKTTRGRKVNSAVKDEVSQVAPAKRARRGAAHSSQETAAVEATVPVSKSAPRGRAGQLRKAEEADNPAEAPAEPLRKGRKAAAKPAVVATENATAAPSSEKMEEEEVAPVEVKKGRAPRKGKAASEASSDKENAVEDVSSAVGEDSKRPKKSVNWKAKLTETHAVTPVVRAARGRKAKLVDEDKDEASQAISTKRGRHSAESAEPSTPQATASKPVNKRKVPSKAEEEDLSDKAVPAEPVKRARRGAKAADSALIEAITPVTEEVPETTDEAPGKGIRKAPKKGKAASKTVDNVQPVEPETQPKPRRGRAAKK